MRIVRWIDEYAEEVVLVALLVIITCSIGLQVVMRYVFNNSLSWPDEVSKFCLVWSAFLSLSFSIKRSNALKLDFLVERLALKTRRILAIATSIFIIALCLYLMPGAWSAIAMAAKIDVRSAALDIPLAWVYASAMIGLVLSVLRCLQRLWLDLSASIENGPLSGSTP